MKRFWNWNALFFLPHTCVALWLLHTAFHMADLLSLVVFLAFSSVFVGFTMVILLRLPLCTTLDRRSIRIRYLLGVEEIPWDTIWKIEPVDYGRGGGWLVIRGTPVGRKRFFFNSQIPDTPKIQILVDAYWRPAPAPAQQRMRADRPLDRKRVAVNGFIRVFFPCGVFVLLVSALCAWERHYAEAFSALVMSFLCLGVSMAFPAWVVFDREGLQVRHLFGFYEGFSWEQLKWLEPGINYQGDYWIPHLHGETNGRKAFFTKCRIPLNRRVKKQMQAYWQQDG